MQFSTVQHRLDKSPIVASDLWHWLHANIRVATLTREQYHALTPEERAALKDGPAFICNSVPARTAAQFKSAEFVVVDLDKGNWLREKILAAIKPHKYILYESPSSAPDAQRWRIVLFTKPILDRAVFSATALSAAAIFGADADRSATNPVQLWYAPLQFDKPVTILRGGRKPFPHAAPGVRAVKSGKFSGPRWTETGFAQAREALMRRDPSCSRAEWRELACALHDGTHGEQDGLDLFIEWSSAGANYLGPADCIKLWDGIEPGRGITRASLFKASAEPRETPPTPPAEPRSRSMAALLRASVQKVYYFWQDILVPGLYLFSAGAKCGKSWLLLNLARAVARGEPFLDRATTRVGLLYIAAEDEETTLQPRIEQLGFCPTDDVDLLLGASLREEAEANCDEEGNPILAPHEWLKQYLITRPHIRVVFLDTGARFEAIMRVNQVKRGSGDVTADHYDYSSRYQNLALELGITIVLVMHTAKGHLTKSLDNIFERHNMADTVVAGATGILLMLWPPGYEPGMKDARRLLAIRHRHAQRDVALEIEFTATSEFKCNGEYHEVRQSNQQGEILATVEALQGKTDRYVTCAEIATEMGLQKNTVQKYVNTMVRTNRTVWKGQRLETKTGREGGIRLSAL
jgi:hypothetical protein